MATILLGAAGAALGAGFGGTVLGLSGAIIGRAVGATLGRVIDQRLLGTGSEPVETGRVDRFRLMGASEGVPVGQVYGRVRVSGQVIWATRFQERRQRSGGGKGAPQPEVTEFTYSISLAVALCEGTIAGIGRIWGDGIELDPDKLNLRVYSGDDAQLPDPKIAAVEGAGEAPAYRGVAYVVIEDLALGDFGNRVPQFSFEVIRPAQPSAAGAADLRSSIRAVAMLPGSGEYALATTRVHYQDGPGRARSANVNTLRGKTDFAVSLEQLRTELPQVGSVSLIVSWFGDDLRCADCQVKPKVEQKKVDGQRMPWRAGGIVRASAQIVPQVEGASIYGGTPADQSVVEAIKAVRDGGQEVMFYPFVLMEQLPGNPLPDPYSDAGEQPALPWRGRITLSVAPGRPGSPDGTAAAEAEVAAFFGAAQPAHFSVANGMVHYTGPQEWGYRRFILHYARLCTLAGGVDAFCIGSELRGLTWIRGPGTSYPAVAALIQLARDVRTILGPGAKISYAADWTEYFGHHADGNVIFHLDPLWAEPAIDFIGIDNYMPLSDWRDGDAHADVGAGSIYNPDYLCGNVAGGEGYDWYYDSPEGAAAQRRLPIEDGAYGEPWVFRYKDLAGWWSNPHHDRIDGMRQVTPTAWVPQSKPIRFTEYGCAAIDKGTNEPNRFLDPRSSESALPKHSNGRRDDLIQMQYYRAMAEYLADPALNPPSTLYAGRMIDADRAHAWAWDARPFPVFPGNEALWQDAGNYARGHWLTGRSTGQSLAQVIAEICERSGLAGVETRGAYGVVRGFSAEGVGTARASLQPLMLAYGFEALERDGALIFRMRGDGGADVLSPAHLATTYAMDGDIETVRAPEAEMSGKVRLSYVEAEGDFVLRQAEATLPDEGVFGVSQSELPLVLTQAEAQSITERWLAEARVARDTARFALPPSRTHIGIGDLVTLQGATWRIDRLEQGDVAMAEAVRIERSVYSPSDSAESRAVPAAFVAPVPVYLVFLDLPLLSGDEAPQAPHVAIAAEPWPGPVAVWEADGEDGFALNTLVAARSIIGVTETPLAVAPAGLWDRGAPLRVRLSGGELSSASELSLLNGANLIAIGDGSTDRWEVLQFAEATLVAPLTYDLSLRLRGQAGSDTAVTDPWPAGSTVVLLNGAPRQIALAMAARGLARTYRIGAAARGFDDPDVEERIEAFQGIGLRPYAPVHLRATALPGALDLRWIRRTRVDGDSWQSTEVPLGEEREAYVVRVFVASRMVRETEVAVPRWTYLDADRLADGAASGFAVEVAQLSDRFGAGLFRRITVAV